MVSKSIRDFINLLSDGNVISDHGSAVQSSPAKWNLTLDMQHKTTKTEGDGLFFALHFLEQHVIAISQ